MYGYTVVDSNDSRNWERLFWGEKFHNGRNYKVYYSDQKGMYFAYCVEYPDLQSGNKNKKQALDDIVNWIESLYN